MHIARVWSCESHHKAKVSACTRYPILMPSMISGWLFLVVSSFWPSLCVSPSPCSSLPTSTCTLAWTPSMWTTPRQSYPAPPPTEESCHLAEFTPPTHHDDVFPCDTTDEHVTMNSWYPFRNAQWTANAGQTYICGSISSHVRARGV